jgi:hypothetical protein
MKFLETTFHEYIGASNKLNLHNNIKYNWLPDKISDLKNIIFYGPSGVGKYTQALKVIKNYSKSELKYEKKLLCTYNKVNYFFKISDIHYEIDMALLGCNARLLWNDIYIKIIDALMANTHRNGIILCKNFNKIHSELLDCFYSYLQKNFHNVNIIFFIITESISFIPDNIINTCRVVPIPRPSKTMYNKITNKTLSNKLNIKHITNIKSLHSNDIVLNNNTINYIDNLYNLLINPHEIKFTVFRDVIYDIFIYDIDIGYIIWNILNKLISQKKISVDKYSYIMLETYSFLQYYNNNYRPIYHLENYLYKIINLINEF